MERKIALITGATSGIGEATARAFATEGWDVIITGRRAERLKGLKAELKKDFDVFALALPFDVRDPHQVTAALDTLPSKWRAIDLLVNNAGLASGLDNIAEGDLTDWEAMIDTNIKGLLYVSRIVSRLMIERGRGGHIVNIGSIAGRQVYEKGAVYCATKHAVRALSQGLRIDLLRHGIKVTEIRPGLVETEFSQVRFHGDEARAAKVYEGFEPLHAEDIADAILWAATRPPHVSIEDIALHPTAQADMHYLIRDN